MNNKRRKQARNERKAFTLRMGIKLRRLPSHYLVLKTTIDPALLDAVRQHWTAMVQSAGPWIGPTFTPQV